MTFFSEVKVEVADYSGILAPIHYITWRHIQEDLDLKML
jgi:hypothetical protein